MKKIILAVLLVLVLVLAVTLGATKVQDTNSTIEERYVYKITEINGIEIYGKALNYISDNNKGVFLYKEDTGFDVEVGDIIEIAWGEDNEILSAEKN